jgi:hypothetical protein
MDRALRKLATLLAVAGLATLCCTDAALATPLGGINIPGLGGSSNASKVDHEIALARSLHAKIVRVDFPWATLEPHGPQLDPQALAIADRLVADAAAAGIKVAATVASTPCWASSAPSHLLAKCRAGRSEAAQAWPPRDPNAYARVLAALAARYGSRLAAIEVWNEPDQVNENYLAGPDKVRAYAAMLRAAYPAVKLADPTLPVLGGSLVGSNGAFLKALYKAGIKGYYDGLSVHFYHLTLASLRSIREVQSANGDSRPLWLDEFGWTSCWPRRRTEQEQACVTAQTQARNLRDSVREIARAPYIAAAMVYKLHDSGAEDFGMLSSAGSRKPAFKALSEAFDRPLGPVSPVTLSLRRSGSSVLASGEAPVGDFMVLEAFQGGVLRYRAIFIQDRFDRFSVPLPPVLGTSGLRVRVFQLWQGAGHAVQRSI